MAEEPWLRIDGISGTSAGVMTAAVLADAHVAGARGVGEGLAEGVPGGAAGFSRASSTAAATSTSALFGIYRWGWGFSTNQDFNGDIALIACFASSWTSAMVRRWHADPFGFLRPWNEVPALMGECATRHAPLDRHRRGHLPDGVGRAFSTDCVFGGQKPPMACAPTRLRSSLPVAGPSTTGAGNSPAARAR